MFRQVLKHSYIWFIIVGVVLYCFGLYETGLTILTQETINYGSYTWTYYKINVYNYLSNIENSLADNSILNVIPQNPILPTAPKWTDVFSILKFVANSLLIFTTNCLIYALNWVVLAPLKVLIYPVNIFYSLLGINTGDSDWIKTIQQIYSFEIPLIPPL